MTDLAAPPSFDPSNPSSQIIVKRRAFICGVSGLELTAAEQRFLGEARPIGFILFARNVQSPGQVANLIADVKTHAGGDEGFLVLIDQEGGRVQRLGAPHWRRYPPAQSFARAFADDVEKAAQAAYLSTRLLADDLYRLGINVSCAPVLDLPVQGADKVIGDRAYGQDVKTVVTLGEAAANGLLDGGVLPVIKHIPGHGRATADSHFALPVIDTPVDVLYESDFAPFIALRHLPMAMTAHVVLSAVDKEAAVTVSRRAINDVVRGMIGFEGLLMSDDVSMQALSGTVEARTRAAFSAGCDIALHCNGKMEEMEPVAIATPELKGDALRRFQQTLACLKAPIDFDRVQAEKIVADLLALSQ